MGFGVAKKAENAHEGSIWTVDWRKDRIVSAAEDGTIKYWNSSQNTIKGEQTISGHVLGIVSVAIDPSVKMCASSGMDSRIKIWNLETGELLKELDASPVETWGVAFSPDSKFIASTGQTGNVTIWNVETGAKEQVLNTSGGAFTLSVAWSSNGQHIACGAMNGIITVFDLSENKRLHSIEGHAMAVRSLTFSPDSSILVSASDDTHVKMYDVKSNGNIATLSGHSSWVISSAYSPNSKTIATGSSDKKVKIWDASSRQCLHTFSEHDDQVWGVSYSDKGNQVVSVSDDKQIIVYDTE